MIFRILLLLLFSVYSFQSWGLADSYQYDTDNVTAIEQNYSYDSPTNFTKTAKSRPSFSCQSGETLAFVFPNGLVAPKRGLSNTNGIRFTQDSIGSKFSDGRSVQGLIDGLKSGKVSPNDIPAIRTFQKDGLTFTLDNRRLFSAHQAGVGVRTVPATAKEIARELPRKFTTPNQGKIIGIRGSLE